MTAAVQLYRWTRDEYERMASLGIFDPEARLELVDGEIVRMTPQSSRHSTAVRSVEEALRFLVDRGVFDVRVQLPLAVADDSEPKPDIAVVPGRFRDYRDRHPSRAELVVEVADASIEVDRVRKQRLYARARIPEYWIADLNGNALELLRRPQGDAFAVRRRLMPDETVWPLCAPDVSISVADLLP
jgi:Uma2 family endonuclease